MDQTSASKTQQRAFPFRLAPCGSQSRSHLRELLVAAASSRSPQHASLLGGMGGEVTLPLYCHHTRSPKGRLCEPGGRSRLWVRREGTFPLGKPRACGRNCAGSQQSGGATVGADAAGFRPEVAQTNLFLACGKTASCSVQYNTLWY